MIFLLPQPISYNKVHTYYVSLDFGIRSDVENTLEDFSTVRSREVFGHIYIVGQDPSACKSSRLHVDIFRFCFHSFEVYCCIDSSKMTGNSPKVSDFNRLSLKLNRFICN